MPKIRMEVTVKDSREDIHAIYTVYAETIQAAHDDIQEHLKKISYRKNLRITSVKEVSDQDRLLPF